MTEGKPEEQILKQTLTKEPKTTEIEDPNKHVGINIAEALSTEGNSFYDLPPEEQIQAIARKLGPDTEEIPQEPDPVKMYFTDLDLNWDTLKGKNVLDLGAGAGDFAHAAKAHDIEVISLDRLLYPAVGKPTAETPYVKADAFHLPFGNDAFDFVVSRAAVHSMVEIEEDISPLINEMKRVMKPGGELRFGPGHLPVNPLRKDELEKLTSLDIKQNNGETLTPDEKIEYDRLSSAYDTNESRLGFNRLKGIEDPLERSQILKQMSLKRLKAIDPGFQEHPNRRNGDPYSDIYYSLIKPEED